MKTPRRGTGLHTSAQGLANGAPQFYKREEMKSRNYRSINLILIEGKSLEQMVKRMVGKHLQKEVKMGSGKTNHFTLS